MRSSIGGSASAGATSAGTTSAESTSAGTTSAESTSAGTTSAESTSAGSTSAESTSAGSTSAESTSAGSNQSKKALSSVDSSILITFDATYSIMADYIKLITSSWVYLQRFGKIASVNAKVVYLTSTSIFFFFSIYVMDRSNVTINDETIGISNQSSNFDDILSSADQRQLQMVDYIFKANFTSIAFAIDSLIDFRQIDSTDCLNIGMNFLIKVEIMRLPKVKSVENSKVFCIDSEMFYFIDLNRPQRMDEPIVDINCYVSS